MGNGNFINRDGKVEKFDSSSSTVQNLSNWLNSSNTTTVPKLNEFDYYAQGKQALKNEKFLANFHDDRIRQLLEECDLPQGFQIFSELDDAFSGITSALLEHLQDELPKKSSLVFGLSNSKSRELGPMTINKFNINHAMLLSDMLEYNVAYFPIYVPSLDSVKSIGRGLELVTRPLRQLSFPIGLSQVTSIFTNKKPNCFSMLLDKKIQQSELNTLKVWDVSNLTTSSVQINVTVSN